MPGETAQPLGRAAARVVERPPAPRGERWNDCACARQSRKFAGDTLKLVQPRERLFSLTITSCSGRSYGSGFSSSAWVTVKIAVLAPMPSASVMIATAVTPGLSQQQANAVPGIAQQILHHAVSLSFFQTPIAFQAVAPAHRSQVVERRPPVPPARRPGARPRRPGAASNVSSRSPIRNSRSSVGSSSASSCRASQGDCRLVAHSASSARPSPRVSRRRLAHDCRRALLPSGSSR